MHLHDFFRRRRNSSAHTRRLDPGYHLYDDATNVRRRSDAIFTEEAASERYEGVLGVSKDPFVSSDIIGDARASIVDLELTRVVDGDLVKVMSWYDNEWGYANQMLRKARGLISS